jgi:predicted transcriptional regulator
MAETVVIVTRVAPELAAKLDRLAEIGQRSRSDTLRLIIENATTDDLIPASLKEAAGDQAQEAAS